MPGARPCPVSRTIAPIEAALTGQARRRDGAGAPQRWRPYSHRGGRM